MQAKLAKLRQELLEPKTSGGGGDGRGFDVHKVGDARVGFVGTPYISCLQQHWSNVAVSFLPVSC